MNFEVAKLSEVPRGLLTGFAQVMLQPSALVGAAFIVGVFWNSYVVAAFGVLGCLSGVLAAIVLDYPEEERHEGLYGFNGALTGLGMSYFYEASLMLAVLVVLGGIASSIVMHRMLRWNMRPFTFPFVFVTWIIMIGLWIAGGLNGTVGTVPDQENIVAFEALSRGIGQVLFQEDVITGIIFVAAIALRDWTQGLFVLLATGLGLGCGFVAGFPVDAINLGLFGYSGVLCGIAFAGRRLEDFASAVAAILLSVIIVRTFHLLDMAALTFPFVLASWIVLWITSKVLRHEIRS
jgi:urea transporter